MTTRGAGRAFPGLLAAGAVALSVLVLLLASACRSSRDYTPEVGPYDRIPEDWSASLWRARFAREDDRLVEAHAILRRLSDERPELIGVRAFLQDVQLALLESGEEVGGLRVPDPAKARAWLGEVYHQRADANPTAERYVLAARLAEDGEVALVQLEEALSLDLTCVWAHYGSAFWFHRMRRFPEARASVLSAFELDPGHMPTMRIHASMQAAAGETALATDCLLTWLKRGETDPLVDPRERAEAQVDLAALRVLDGEPGEALALLEAIDRDLLRDPPRAELIRAVALGDQGRHALALSAARRAKEQEPDNLQPLLYQAMILQRQGSTTQERATLLAVLAEIRAQTELEAARPLDPDDPGEFDFPRLLIQLYAQTRLERIERERDSRP